MDAAALIWIAVAVEAGTERDTAEDIRETLGFAAFVPVETIWKTLRGRRVQAGRPLFIGYCFVGVHPKRQDWQRIFDVDGVMDVLCHPVEHGDKYLSHIKTEWIIALQKMQEYGAFDRTKIEPDGFKIGDKVRVAEGPLAGFMLEIKSFSAKLKSATAKKRAKLIGSLLGRMTTFEMDVTALEKA